MMGLRSFMVPTLPIHLVGVSVMFVFTLCGHVGADVAMSVIKGVCVCVCLSVPHLSLHSG